MIREILKRHEGLSLTKYRDTEWYWTIGWGWNLDAHPLPEDIASCLRSTGAITLEMAERLLSISIDCAIKQCRSIYPGFDEFSEARRAALTDWMFNCGVRTVLTFKKTLESIKEGRWEDAADELLDSDYAKQVHGRAKELADLIRNGLWGHFINIFVNGVSGKSPPETKLKLSVVGVAAAFLIRPMVKNLLQENARAGIFQKSIKRS